MSYEDPTPEEYAAASRHFAESNSNPTYLGVAIWGVIDVIMLGVGVLVIVNLVEGRVSSDPLPIIILLVICGAAVPFAFLLVKWTFDVAARRRELRYAARQ